MAFYESWERPSGLGSHFMSLAVAVAGNGLTQFEVGAAFQLQEYPVPLAGLQNIDGANRPPVRQKELRPIENQIDGRNLGAGG